MRRALTVGASIAAASLALALGPTLVGTDSGTTDGAQPERASPEAVIGPPAPSPAQPAAKAPAARNAAARCEAESLRTLGGRFGSATAAADRYVVGVSHDAHGTQHPVLWRNGVPARLDTGFTLAIPTGVSPNGAVVGAANDRSVDAPVGWYWAAGRTWRLQGTEDRAAVPEAINASGVIVGGLAEIETVSHPEHEQEGEGHGADLLVNERAHDEETEKAALWTSFRAAPRVLRPLPGDDGGHAYAVSPSGVAGGLSMGQGFTPVVWDSAGRAHALATLAGGWGIVRGFDHDNLPVGEATNSAGVTHVVRWTSEGRVVDLGPGSVQKYLASLSRGVGVGSQPDAMGAPHPVTWRCS